MFVLLEIADFAAVKTLLLSIPESLGVLIFGVVLVLSALLLRKILRRTVAENRDRTTAK